MPWFRHSWRVTAENDWELHAYGRGKDVRCIFDLTIFKGTSTRILRIFRVDAVKTHNDNDGRRKQHVAPEKCDFVINETQAKRELMGNYLTTSLIP